MPDKDAQLPDTIQHSIWLTRTDDDQPETVSRGAKNSVDLFSESVPVPAKQDKASRLKP